MMKHVGKIVCKMWENKRYHSRITDVTYHDVYARWMYVVNYIAFDGDREDYWRSELTLLLCRCEDTQNDD